MIQPRKLFSATSCLALASMLCGTAAFGDELSDLKAQSDALKQQNEQLLHRIEQIEQKQQQIQAIAPPAPGVQLPAADGSLTWHGVTLYGGIDLGVGYQNHGTPLNGDYGPGLEYLVSKNSNHSNFGFAPNALSYTNLGLKGSELLFGDVSGIFNIQTSFVPTSGALSDGTKSLVENNGVPLNRQTSNGDSSRAGQPFNAAAYIGFSSPTYGTITFGRQNSLTLDGVIAYDPQGASNAFSVIGYQGATAGIGDTEDARLDASVKYRVNVGPVRLAALYQLSNTGSESRTAYEFGIGGDYGPLSVDAIYSQVFDAISAASLSAAQVLTEPTGSLAATVSDNTSYMFLASYTLDPVKFLFGAEKIQFDNPENPLANGSTGLGGYILSVVNNTAFNENRQLNVYWTGFKWAATPDLDISGGYYHEYQPSFHAVTSCSNNSAASCSGTLDAVSLVADYRLTKRFDVYAGAMYSQVSDGLESGFFHASSIDPTVGARFRF